MVLKLYHDPLSQPSRAVYLLLKSNNIHFEEIIISISKGEQSTPKFEALNPFKAVPVIEHDGFVLTESVAILQYICRTFSVASHWYPTTEPKVTAKIDEYMSWQQSSIRPIGSLNFITITQPLQFAKKNFDLFGGSGTRDERIVKFRLILNDLLSAIEGVWLQGNAFISGNELTIADLLAVEEMEQPRYAGIDIHSTHPKIKLYMDRVKEKLEPHYTHVHTRALEIIEEMKHSPEQSNYLKYQK